MAIIKKTISGLKPDSNYLFAVKPKNTEISATDEIPEAIRVKTPSTSSVPSAINNLSVVSNFQSVMFSFSPVGDQDFAEYEYEIYNSSTASSGSFVSSGKKRSSVFVVSVPNTTQTINPTTGVATTVTTKYWGRVRAINTSGISGPWTSPVTHAGDSELISDQYIGTLTAAKITAGIVGAEQIILKNQTTQPTNYTPTTGISVIRSSDYVQGSSGWIIKGDGTAEFSEASIRGTLSAKNLYINAYNRWGRNSTDTGDESSVFVVGNATNQLYWNPTGGTSSGSLLQVGNSTNYMKWDNNTLTVTGAITTGAAISSSTVGGLTIGTNEENKVYLGTGTYAASDTPFFVGWDTSGGVSANKFSIGNKLYFDGSNLTIVGTMTISGTSTINGEIASTVVTKATGAIQSGGAAADINSNTTTISGGKITTNTIDVDKLIAGTLTGYTIQNATSNPNFKVDTDGNVFANNIYATGSAGGTQQGLTIRSDGTGGAPASAGGSLYIFSAVGTTSNDSSQYKVRIGSSSRYLEISYPITTVGSRQHVNVETTVSGQHLRLSSASGQLGLLGNTQTNRNQNAVTVAGDIVLENYGPDAIEGGNSGGSRTVFSKNIGASSSGTTCRIGLLDGLEFYGSPGSLRELKENIEDISGIEAINIVKSLRPRKFTWKPTNEDTELGAALKKLDLHYGFVAEEVQEAQPQLATYKMTPEFQDSWPNITDQMFNEFPLIFYKDAEMPSIAIAAVKNLIERVEFLESHLAAQ